MKFNVLKGPFFKSKNSTHRIMINLFIALLPIILFSFYKNGVVVYQNGKTDIFGMFYPLLFTLTGVISSFLTETLYTYIFLKKRGNDLKQSILNSFSIFPGLFVSLFLPLNTPIEILIFGCVVAIIIGKMLYGGFGHNIFNPALIGVLFTLTCYGSVITQNGGYINKYELDTIGSATPLTHYQMLDGIGTYDTVVKPFGTLKDFFIGNIPGGPGEVCSFLIILAFIYLVFTKVIKWKIPVIYVGTVFVMTSIIGSINEVGLWYPTFSILSGGLLFGAVFMATDPVTSPTTSVGQIIYALFLGILTVTFRYLTSAPEGVLTSILTMNMFVMILDRLGSSNKPSIRKIALPLLIGLTIMIGVSIHIGNKFKNPSDTDYNFKIFKKTKDYYIVSQKGNGGPIKAKIYIKDNQIIKFEILENNETENYFKLVKDSKYIKKLIKNQNNLENIDTVSGATISSTALKKMLINVKKDMEGSK